MSGARGVRIELPATPKQMPSVSKVWAFWAFLIFGATYWLIATALPWPGAMLAYPPYTMLVVAFARYTFWLGLKRQAEEQAAPSSRPDAESPSVERGQS